MQRVAIVGSGGAGKSTVARELAASTGLPMHHLDTLFWRPGWEMTDDDEWAALQHRLVADDRWIIDGNYSSTLHIRLPAADTIVFLDLSRVLCTRRAAWRSLRRWGERRADLAPGCDERFDLAFLRWVWNFPRDSRPKLVEAIRIHGGEGKRVVWLRRPADVTRFLAAPDDHPSLMPI